MVLACTGGCARFASEWDETDAAVAGELRPTAPDWSCVSEQARATPIAVTTPPPLQFSMQVVDFVTGAVPPGLRVRACYRVDVQCTSPLVSYTGPDAAGVVALPLKLGFNGFLELTANGMVPTLYFFPDALSPALVKLIEPVPMGLLSIASFGAFGASGQFLLDPQSGVVSMNAFDCNGPHAKGVRLELNVDGLPFAFVDGLPVPFQDTTSEEGSAGFANVQPGLVVVKGYTGDDSELVGLETVLVRSQWVTVGSLLPQFAQ